MQVQVREIMKKEVISVTSDTTIRKALETFHSFCVDTLPVISREYLVGLFSKSCACKAILDGAELDDPIEKYMDTKFKAAFLDNRIADAWQIQENCLPVIDDERRLVGILTRADLMLHFIKSAQEGSSFINTVLNSTYNAIVAVNRDGKITIFNKSAERFTSWTASEALGKNVNEVIPDTGLLDVLKTGQPEYAQKMKIAEYQVISNRSPIYCEGALIGAVGVAQDISSLENISEELQAMKNLNSELEAIIESCHDAIVVTDREGKLERLNSAYERISGIQVKDMLGKRMRDLEDQGVVSQSVSLLVLKDRKPVTIMQKLNTGKEIIVTGTPVIDEEGRIIKVVTTGRDMTELNNLKEELEKTKELSHKYYNELKCIKKQLPNSEEIVFHNEKMKEVIALCMKIAEVDSSVLLLGETGVGKEILAKIIHNSSNRKNKPFIKINCGAIPENLMESELFGYEDGAFTGARKGGKIGLFEAANRGTLFLDEIGEVPFNLQVKLLRVLQEQEITKIGASVSSRVDVRIIAATNKDLSVMVNEGKFRKDLYYRLNVVPIKMPPLRERREDIIPLAHHFLKRFNEKYQTNKRFSTDILKALLEYDWPGNIRELENIIERLIVTSNTDEILREQLPFAEEHEGIEENIKINEIIPLKEAVRILEQKLVNSALEKYGTGREAAKALGVNPSTIARKRAR